VVALISSKTAQNSTSLPRLVLTALITVS